MLAPHGESGRWYDWADRFVADPAVEDIFDRYRPTLVAVATPGLVFAEIPLLRVARRCGVRTMALDLSWDSLTNKLLPIRRVDRLIVWNSTMRREAHELHGYSLEDVDIAGPPQFDGYFNGAICLFRTAVLFDPVEPSLYGDKVAAYRMSPPYGLDIDEPEDWETAERLLTGATAR